VRRKGGSTHVGLGRPVSPLFPAADGDEALAREMTCGLWRTDGRGNSRRNGTMLANPDHCGRRESLSTAWSQVLGKHVGWRTRAR
jgi:hypothetical protein